MKQGWALQVQVAIPLALNHECINTPLSRVYETHYHVLLEDEHAYRSRRDLWFSTTLSERDQ
jgi:hypothetical protein